MSTLPEYCFLFINWWPFCMQKSEWASWVQALGAIAAIGIAIWLAKMQAERSERLQRQMEVVRLGEKYGPAIAIIIEYVKHLQDLPVNRSSMSLKYNAETSPALRALLDMKEAFRSLPVHAMPTVPSTIYLLQARKLISEAEENLGMFKDRPYMTAVERLKNDSEKQRIVGGLMEISDALRGDLVKLTAPEVRAESAITGMFKRIWFRVTKPH